MNAIPETNNTIRRRRRRGGDYKIKKRKKRESEKLWNFLVAGLGVGRFFSREASTNLSCFTDR